MKTIAALLLSGIFLLPVRAADEPTKLKCVTDAGLPAADLVIDLANRTMTWAISKYRITSVTDKFISAHLEDSEVGGETWVLDRVTGKYLRAAIALFCDEKGNCSKTPDAAVYRGVCTKGVI